MPTLVNSCGCFAVLISALLSPAGLHAQEAVATKDPLRVARGQLVTGQYTEAEGAFRQLLEANKSNEKALFGLVKCLIETGEYTEAKLTLDATTPKVKRLSKWSLYSANVAEAFGDYQTALDHARDARDRDRSSCVARLHLARYLEEVGEYDAALDEYTWFDRLVTHRLPIDAENLTAAGAGFYRYSVLSQHPNLIDRTRHVLQKIYQQAYLHLDPQYWPARLAVADLLREKYSYREAEDDYRAVLDINTNAVDAHIGLGWIALNGWKFEEVDAQAQAALDVNTNSIKALVLLSTSRMLERRYQAANDYADRALAINANGVESLALKAGASMALNDDPGAQQFIERANRVNPKSGRFHRVLGSTLSMRRQYPESEIHYLKAVEFEPSSATAQADLGMMYMQWGDERKARVALEAAWKLDAFNERTKNTLDLLDDLDRYARLETEHFDIRCAPGNDEVIAKRAGAYLESIYDDICQRFEIELDRKTIVEIFPAHSDFGVRITGKPWVGAGGACTGWVIAVPAPGSGEDDKSPFFLPTVLRHEFVHTVTLAATNNRIPHWMTEGLATLHEDLELTFDWKKTLANRIRKDELFSLDNIDWGFARPRRPDDRLIAYAQSEMMCAYLMDRFGDGIINTMLHNSRQGVPQTELFAKHTNLSTEEFDQAFRQWAIQRATPWGFDLTPPEDSEALGKLVTEKPNDASLRARLAIALLDAGEVEEAKPVATKSLALDATSNALGHEAMMRVLSAELEDMPDAETYKSCREQIIEHANNLLLLNPQHRGARMTVAFDHLNNKRMNAALPHLLDLLELPPVDPAIHLELARIYRTPSEDELALPHWTVCVSEFEHNPEVPTAIAEIHLRAGRFAKARQWYENALAISPLSQRLGEKYAELLMQKGDTLEAVERYQQLCRIAPDKAEFQTGCALALFKSGDKQAAQAYAKRAVALDPNSKARELLN